MQLIEGSKRIKRNKNANRLNFRKGSQSRSPSQTTGAAKIQINSQKAIENLKKLAKLYSNINDPFGFLTNLRLSLGLPNSKGASKYGVVSIPKDDGSKMEVSIRITNHNANANTYLMHNANYDYNLSIVVRRKMRRNTFVPNDNVCLDEYVYYGNKLEQTQNPLSKIIEGIIGFIQTGIYSDKTGVSLKNVSPQQNNNQIKDSIEMNKGNKIRLTESQLHKVIKEAVNKILKEDVFPYKSNQSSTMNNYIQNDIEHEEFMKRYKYIYDVIREKGDDEVLYLQVGMMFEPNRNQKMGAKITQHDIRDYKLLTSNDPEDVLDLWRNYALIGCDIAQAKFDYGKFDTEEDSDGVYLMIRVDNEEELKEYLKGNW